MQQIIGRLTADAILKQLPNSQQVVNFNLADNQDYKPKGSDEWIKNVTYFNCSLWQHLNKVKVLRKGATFEDETKLKAANYKYEIFFRMIAELAAAFYAAKGHNWVNHVCGSTI